MTNQQLENKLQFIQPTTICKYVIILCICIFTIVIPLSYYYSPVEQRDGRRGFYMSTNHSAQFNSSVTSHDLESALEKASMPNRTVIITTINAAWAKENGMLDLYLRSFRIGEGTQHLLENLLLVALDQEALKRCEQIHPHCYILLKEGSDFSGEKVIMTQGYLDMMWARIFFLKHVLELGYSFVFSDADILWFRNPFQLFDDKADFQIASDYYNGNPHDLSNTANGGFNFVRSSNRSIKFYEWWYESRTAYPKLHDQDVLNKIKSGGHLSEIGLKMLLLDTKYICGFCERRAGLEDVFTMHANCCKGMKAKIADLTLILQDWASYRSLNSSAVHWRAPHACLHSWMRIYCAFGIRSNEANGGFNFVRSNERSIRFYEWWYDSRISYPNMHDQHVSNQIKSGSYFSEIGLKSILCFFIPSTSVGSVRGKQVWRLCSQCMPIVVKA